MRTKQYTKHNLQWFIDRKDKIILHLCADTGSDSKVWQDEGYEVIKIGSDIGVENYHPPQGVFLLCG